MNSNQLLVEDIQRQVRVVIRGVHQNFKTLAGVQNEFVANLKEIRHRLDCLETFITGSPLSRAPVYTSYKEQPGSTSTPPAPSKPSQTLFTIPNPITTSLMNIVFEPSHSDHQPSPILGSHHHSDSFGHTKQFSNPENLEDLESPGHPSKPSLHPSSSPTLTPQPQSPTDSFNTPSDPSTTLVVYGSILPPPAHQRSDWTYMAIWSITGDGSR